jgi:hypothetical protein
VGLESSTGYHFRIGCLGERFSSAYSDDDTATTLTKKVRVTFESLELQDDSDFVGAGDLFFAFEINGERVHRYPNAGRVDVSGPCGGVGQGCVDETFETVETDLPRDFVRSVDPEDPSIQIRISGNDDDGIWGSDRADREYTFAVPLTVETSSTTRTPRANEEDLDFRVRVRFDVFHE